MAVLSGLVVRGQALAIEALSAASIEAHRAQASAMRAARTRARSVLVREAAAVTGTPLKVWRRRVQSFGKKTRRGALARAVLWLGRGLPPSGGEHKTVESILLARTPGGFAARMRSGHRGVFKRRTRRRLKIDEVFLQVPASLESSARDAARDAMRGRYIDVLTSDYRRRMQRVALKAKRK